MTDPWRDPTAVLRLYIAGWEAGVTGESRTWLACTSLDKDWQRGWNAGLNARCVAHEKERERLGMYTKEMP